MQGQYLTHIGLRCTACVTSNLVLPPYKGSVFRGAFGKALHATVCKPRSTGCNGCTNRENCIYQSVFQPTSPPNLPDADKFRDIPRPFVLIPPMTNRQFFRPGKLLKFEAVVIGKAMEAFDQIIDAIALMGEHGLGPERGKYKLLHLSVRNGQHLNGRKNRRNRCRPIVFFEPAEALQPEYDKSHTAVCSFNTPMRLKEKGHLVKHLTFRLFFERLAQRIDLLNRFFEPHTEPPDFSHLLANAHQIKTAECNLHWYEWERYSARQKERMKLGGLKGTVAFQGELGPYVPFLKIGENVSVGQGTTFGLGRYSLSLA